MNAREFATNDQLLTAMNDITRYEEAFVKANPNTKKPKVGYKKGWYLIDHAGLERIVRPTEFNRMTDRLESRER